MRVALVASLIALLLQWSRGRDSGFFTNPIVAHGADPWVIQHEGSYYYCYSTGEEIWVSKAKKLQDIGKGDAQRVFKPAANTSYSKEIWAPELHLVRGKWVIYFAADDGNNAHHRMYVIDSDHPQGPYTFRGKIAPKTDKWAIDGTVLQTAKGELYFIWSGWEGDVNYQQSLYIAAMSNHWTISGDRVRISVPTEEWEKRSQPFVPGGINEGPEVFSSKGKIFIVYSASGSWNDEYCLGWIENTDGNVMNPGSWKKRGPVFSKAPTAFGPGHASFTKSPDRTEDWIVYHACVQSGGGWAGRSVRIQKFLVGSDGIPSFGTPIKCFEPIPEPSGG